MLNVYEIRTNETNKFGSNRFFILATNFNEASHLAALHGVTYDSEGYNQFQMMCHEYCEDDSKGNCPDHSDYEPNIYDHGQTIRYGSILNGILECNVQYESWRNPVIVGNVIYKFKANIDSRDLFRWVRNLDQFDLLRWLDNLENEKNA